MKCAKRGKPNRFPKEERMHRQRDFQRCVRSGKRWHSPLFTLCVYWREPPGRKVAFSVGKQVGKPVVRNNVKRWLREAYRTQRSTLREGVDLLFLVQPSCAKSNLAEVSQQMQRLLRTARVIDVRKLKTSR